MEHNFEYQVALSFAGEQRDYVEKVTKELDKLNVKYFYDYNEQVNLWGKNLSQYLDSVYFEKSMYFVPFISKEYVKNIWTRLEINSAIDRNILETHPDFQQYILPVRFDDTRVPGIVGTLAYLDAKKATPKEIAHMISEKVGGETQNKQIDPKDYKANLFSIKYNDKINADRFEKMEDIFSRHTASHTMIIYGEKGLGKRSCVQRFLQTKESIITISPNIENRFQLEPIIHSFQLDVSRFLLDSDLCFEDQIKQKIFSICKLEPIIIYIEQFHDLDAQSARFLLDTTEILLSRFSAYRTFIIFELDIAENISLLAPFYKFSPEHTDFVRFSRLSSNSLKDYFFNVLGDIIISSENLDYIMESSFGNIMYLNVAINYLKGESYIRFENGKYICDILPSGVLADILKDFILQRYNRLDNNLKEVISKSSIIGSVFNSELLSKPFQIINADNLLQEIEKISQLIIRPDDISYSFENNDVYHLIRNNIAPNLQEEWHGILANYYEKLLVKEWRRKGQRTIKREISLLYQVAYHYEHAKNYVTAIHHYRKLLLNYEQIQDYVHALAVVQEIKSMLEYVDLNNLKGNFFELEYEIYRAEANCCKNIGDFSKACEAYEECLSFYDTDEFSEPVIELRYQLSYCLYMNGKIQESLKTLVCLKEYFEMNNICNYSYIKILSLLASTCDVTGDVNNQKKYYTRALDFYKANYYEQEYYVLLRMASMVFGEEIALSMETEAEKYFRKEHSSRYLAEVLHNIGTDRLYIDQLGDVLKNVDESIELFDTFGSIAVHYPLNTKGILKMVLDHDFEAAVSLFEQALFYEMEPYSEITIRTNILNCLNILEKHSEALKQLEQIDELIKMQESQHIPKYLIYQNLNWAFYYFHIKNYEKCLQKLNVCSMLDYMEPRFKYIYKSLIYKTKKVLGINARNMAGTAPKKVYKKCVENGFYFTTLRFYESV